MFFLFISGELLSLNVAGDSAKTLSVLENMEAFLDDCGLRFVHKWRRPPQYTPDFGEPKKAKNKFHKITGMQPYRNHIKSIN